MRAPLYLYGWGPPILFTDEAPLYIDLGRGPYILSIYRGRLYIYIDLGRGPIYIYLPAEDAPHPPI